MTVRKRSDTWITPQWIIDKIGMSDLDPCGYKLDGKHVVTTAHQTYCLEDNQDGLALPWEGSVYCNPPYSAIPTWWEKCRKYHEETGNDVILNLFVRTETTYFQRFLPSATGIVLMAHRIKFLNSQGKIEGDANIGSVLIAYGENAYQRIKRVAGTALRLDQNQKSDDH
jgi:hypothetical protein